MYLLVKESDTQLDTLSCDADLGSAPNFTKVLTISAYP